MPTTNMSRTATSTAPNSPTGRTLPPGQRRLDGFPRFGTHLSAPPPPVPADPVIEIRGAGITAFEVPLAALAALPRQELVADFHCVSGWTATDLRWDGVPFAILYDELIVPALPPDIVITHVEFRGLDGFRSVVQLEDARADEVFVADRLDGRPLGGDHGAPVRVVSPSQYGYISTKHLCRIEVHTSEPEEDLSSIFDRLIRGHPRARVWHEERHGKLPGWLVRPVYRALKPLFFALMRPRR